MNIKYYRRAKYRAGMTLGLLLAMAAALGTSQARSEEVIVYAKSIAYQVAAEKAELQGAMDRSGAKASSDVTETVRADLERQIKPIRLARAPVSNRGQG